MVLLFTNGYNVAEDAWNELIENPSIEKAQKILSQEEFRGKATGEIEQGKLRIYELSNEKYLIADGESRPNEESGLLDTFYMEIASE